jgi:hypothetical protein
MKGACSVIVLLTLLISGCTNSAKIEATTLVEAVDQFRRAENPDKAGKLAAVEAAPCTDRDVCAAKEACLAYAAPTVKGLNLKSEVQTGLADLEEKKLAPDAEAARALPGKLDEASRLLDRGHAALPACDQKVLSLKVRFAL